MGARRPGFQPVFQLPQPIRIALEPVVDILMRLVGAANGIPKLTKIVGNVTETLPATATVTEGLSGASTLAQTITRVNEIAVAVNLINARVCETAIATNIIKDQLNAVIDRLQED